MDGWVAAWAAWVVLGDAAEFVPSMYDDPAPSPERVAGRDVWVLDFSFPRPVLLDLARAASSLRVLDHHKTARDALQGLPGCVFDMNRSGAALAWDEFHPLTPAPWVVRYVEDRDLWRHALPDTHEVNAALASIPRGSFRDWEAQVLRTPLERHITDGAAILRARTQEIAQVASQARPGVIAGRHIPVVNCPRHLVSDVTGRLAEGSDEGFAAGWQLGADGRVMVSLRARPRGGDGKPAVGAEGGKGGAAIVDVADIAKGFGGGGHPGAAGFTLDPVHLSRDALTFRLMVGGVL